MRAGLILIALFICAPAPCGAQRRWGWIDPDSVIAAVPQFAVFDKQVDSLLMRMDDTLCILGQVLDEFPWPHNTSLGPGQREALTNRLAGLQQALSDYQDAAGRRLDSARREAGKAALAALVIQLDAYRAARNIAAIARRSDVICCEGCEDFTDDFIRFANQQH